MGYLYKLTSPTNKSYIGITMFPLEKRLLEHRRNATKKNGRGPLRSAIRKYGIDAFRCDVLAERETWPELCELERQAIADHGTFCPHGYNMTIGGDGVPGLDEDSRRLHREKTIIGTRKAWRNESMRLKRARAFNNPDVKAKQSETTKRQMAEAYKNPEFAQKIREARQRPEFRELVRQQQIQRWKDPVYRANMVAKRLGRGKRSEESLQAQSDKMRAIIAERKRQGTYWHGRKSA